jgi:hypothetical protein
MDTLFWPLSVPYGWRPVNENNLLYLIVCTKTKYRIKSVRAIACRLFKRPRLQPLWGIFHHHMYPGTFVVLVWGIVDGAIVFNDAGRWSKIKNATKGNHGGVPLQQTTDECRCLTLFIVSNYGRPITLVSGYRESAHCVTKLHAIALSSPLSRLDLPEKNIY